MALNLKKPLPESLLQTTVQDQNGNAIPFKKILEGRGTLIILIRHFACIGCTTQMLAIAPKLNDLKKLGIKVKVIGNGEARYIEGFMDKFQLHNKPVDIYTDPSLEVYEAAQMHRTFWHFINPVNFWQYIKSFSKGITQGKIQGDNIQMGGVLLVSDKGELEYYFQNKTITGISDPNEIMSCVHKYVLRNKAAKV